MQLEVLKIFCDVAQARSFSRGAAINQITQSAVSQAIGQLEKRLATRLIDRSRRPLLLTAAGRLFFERCLELLAEYQRLEEAVQGQASRSATVLRVAAIYSVGFQNMQRFVADFQKLHPQVTIALDYVAPVEVYRRLKEDRAELGIVSYPRASREWEPIPWRREPMVIACLPTDPLAGAHGVEPRRLAGRPFIAFTRGLPIRRELDRYFRSQGVRLAIAIELDNIDSIKQAVEDGGGITLVPEPTVSADVRRGNLAWARLAGPPLERPVGILRRRRLPRSRGVDDFVALLTHPGHELAALSWAKAAGGDASGDAGREAKEEKRA